MEYKRGKLAAGLALALVLAVPVAGISKAGGGSLESSATAAENATPSRVSDVVAALRQPRSAADSLPATAQTEVISLGPTGTQPESSVLSLARGSWQLYLTPSPEGVCVSIVDPDGGASASCRTREALEEGSALPAAVREGCTAESRDADPVCTTALVYGVVPNGVKEITVEVGSGPAPTAEVQGNVYLVRAPLSQRPTAVRYEGPRGSVHQPVPIPKG